MKLEKLTLLAATALYAGFLIRDFLRARADHVCRLAAGESPYERSHPRP